MLCSWVFEFAGKMFGLGFCGFWVGVVGCLGGLVVWQVAALV